MQVIGSQFLYQEENELVTEYVEIQCSLIKITMNLYQPPPFRQELISIKHEMHRNHKLNAAWNCKEGYQRISLKLSKV